MINKGLKSRLEPILSNREIEVVLKRLNNKHITQTESNYLSRSIRPKLKSAEFAVSSELLSLLDYRRKRHERKDHLLRKRIVGAVGDIIDNVKVIILFGSYVRNNHINYRDIDVLIVLSKKIWKTSAGKHRLEKNIERAIDIRVDINLVVYSELVNILPYSPLLQVELENHKIIYGDIKIKKKIIVNKLYLYKKLLELESIIELGKKIESKYIYNAIRTCLSIKSFLKKVVDSELLIKTIENNIGKLTADSLIEGRANSVQKDIALRYLKYLYNNLLGVLK